MLCKFKKVDSPLCSYCNTEEETPLHLFYFCPKTENLWNKLRQYLSKSITIPQTTPQSSIFGFLDINEHSMLINHLFLIFKYHVFNARKTKLLDFETFKVLIRKVKETEKNLLGSNKTKILKKWRPIDQVIG